MNTINSKLIKSIRKLTSAIQKYPHRSVWSCIQICKEDDSHKSDLAQIKINNISLVRRCDAFLYPQERLSLANEIIKEYLKNE
jgi:hypothetical protein